MKPRLDCLHGIWRCWLIGTRIAGFGHSPKEAWDDYQRQIWKVIGLPREEMGS